MKDGHIKTTNGQFVAVVIARRLALQAG